MNGRRDDARFDAAIHDRILRDTGVVEEDEPTEYSHWAYMQSFHERAEGEFTRSERREIRVRLGLGPFVTEEAGE